ncbi:hypothetical protein PFISCL1PPCAC_15756, partial [Pristionchus fissidentatus]
ARMKTLILLSVISSPIIALFRSNSYSYSYGSPYYSSSSYYYSDNYYTSSYRSNSRYSSDDYQSYTYMDGSHRPTVTREAIMREAEKLANSESVIQSSSSFKVGKLQYYWGSQYMSSQDCGDNKSNGKRNKRMADVEYTTTTTPRVKEGRGSTEKGATIVSHSPIGTTYPSNFTQYYTTGKYSSVSDSPMGSTPSIISNRTQNSTKGVDSAVTRSPKGEFGNFSDIKDLLAYMNMFYVNFSDPAESLNYVEIYLPDNFTASNYANSSEMMAAAVSNLPYNISSHYSDIASTMMAPKGNISKSVDDWYKDIKDEQSYNDMISSTNGSGPVQTKVGCSSSSAVSMCTRSLSDLDPSIYTYIFSPSFPSEISWQCPDKSYYCCEWECCKEKKWNTAGIIGTVIFCLLALSCCCCMCCLCCKGKEKEKETIIVAMYPKPQPQAYFISAPPRVYY